MDKHPVKVQAFLLVFALFLLSCGSIPDDTVSSSGNAIDGQVYENTDWGFLIIIPDNSVWGWSSQTSYQSRASNGLPQVELVMRRDPLDGFTFWPTMTLRPRALSSRMTLQTLAAELEEGFKAAYIGYEADEKRIFEIGGREAVEWTFTSVGTRSLGNRFLVTAVVDGRKGYVLVGSGLFSSFPVEEFRSIASTMVFR